LVSIQAGIAPNVIDARLRAVNSVAAHGTFGALRPTPNGASAAVAGAGLADRGAVVPLPITAVVKGDKVNIPDPVVFDALSIGQNKMAAPIGLVTSVAVSNCFVEEFGKRLIGETAQVGKRY
jgi:hypothetical protein